MAEINFGKSITLKQAAGLIKSNPETRFLLQGEPGIGKSSLLEDIANGLGYDYAYIPRIGIRLYLQSHTKNQYLF